jgi:DnaJ-class molecular chaperone
MKAERCPVCYGTGKYTDPSDPMTTAVPGPRTCHGCAGKGWVEVQQDITIPGYYIPYDPFVQPYNPYETTSP